MFDLDAYLGRIGLSGRPSIDQVHRAHISSIPFENLDPHRGVPVKVDPMLARVRAGAPPGVLRPQSHLVLRVRAEGSSWPADVGFGLGRLLEPIPSGSGTAHSQSGWSFRVVRDGPELVLQTGDGDDWSDVYGFVPQPVPTDDTRVTPVTGDVIPELLAERFRLPGFTVNGDGRVVAANVQ